MTQTQIPVGWASTRIRAKGDYSIDRAHSVDCILNNPHVSQPVVDQLERVIAYLDARTAGHWNRDANPFYLDTGRCL